jgi:hypothetical protein
MKVSFKIVLFFALLFSANRSIGQIAIGQWRDHLSFKRALDLCEAGDKIYCAAGSNLFSYNKLDGSVERYSKINGLSDIGVTKVAYDAKRNVLIIAYADANIDLIKEGKIINVADIKRKSILGSKSINHILVNDDFTYLSCGFGVVVLDLDKNEVKDTYYLSNNNPAVNELLLHNSTFYAATTTGVYFASKNNANLANPANWKLEPGLPGGNYNTLAVFGDSLLINKPTATAGKIYIRSLSNSNWIDYQNGAPTLRIKPYGDKLYLVFGYGISVRDLARNQVNYLGGAFGYPPCSPPKVCYPKPLNVIVDKDGIVWLIDASFGLIEYPALYTFRYPSPSGPFTNNVYDMSFTNSNLWVAPGGHDDAWTNLYNQEGISSMIDEEWAHKDGDGLFDIFKVKQDPSDENKIYATSWFQGLALYNANIDTPVVVYNSTNSSLKQWNLNPGFFGISGLDFDSQGNLWVANAYTSTLINVLKTDGKWRAFNTAVVPELNSVLTGAIIATQSNQKWILLPRQSGGILVFDDNGTIDDVTDDKIKKLNYTAGTGGMVGSEVYAIAEDKNGEIWVGTEKGINVFYSPSLVFTNENYDAQQIKIEQDGNIQFLLETELVTAIAVDGANRKWVGTQNSGVYFMSSDGTQQLNHFTAENSPLFSNNITSIAINPESGEVFFGTDLGIISYRSTATEGVETCEIFVYPNPVKDKYNGVIAIKGLTQDASVKITDVSGSLIYQTKALGGQAIWDGKTLQGEKAASGVYLVFSTNTDGSETCTTKILIVN